MRTCNECGGMSCGPKGIANCQAERREEVWHPCYHPNCGEESVSSCECCDNPVCEEHSVHVRENYAHPEGTLCLECKGEI